MSAKLQPEDLTSEERAIVDNAALFYRRVTGDVGETAEWAYVEALKEAEPIILARRALFAPEPEKVECPNCRQPTSSVTEHIFDEMKPGCVRTAYTCHRPKPAQPEEKCPHCGQEVTRHTEHVGFSESNSAWQFTCQPAQPAPKPEPAAPEMPEAVRGLPWEMENLFLLVETKATSLEVTEPDAARHWRLTVSRAKEAWWRTHAAQPVAVGMTKELADLLDSIMAFADADPDTPVKQIWRKKVSAVREQAAQPVAVGMTEELEHVLSIAERDLRYKEECFDDSARTVPDERIERLRAAIAAVREQAGNGRKVECPNCGKGVAYEHLHRDSWMDRAGYVQARYVCKRPQPAPPEPAAREMPEAVRTISAARKYAAEFDHPTSMEFHIRVDGFVAGAKRERNLAQPVAVGMTEELRMILDVAESRAEDQRHDGLLECSRNLERAIAAVRQQAAQGRKVELGKVRAYFNTPSALRTVGDERAALAEIDAAEGKGEGRG